MEVHFEPFLQCADLGAEEAMIAWGGFYFRRGDSSYGEWRIVDDEELRSVAGERSETIGAGSEPYGEAVVEVERNGKVVQRAEAADRNQVRIKGLDPDTEYTYRVVVDGETWATGERCDWDTDRRTLARRGARYDNRFHTFPATDSESEVTVAVLGDFGVGILGGGENSARQQRVARALERACNLHDVVLVLTTGDNIYLGPQDTVSGTGNEDDDWYANFFQPYRYVLNRVPFFPTVGNHDAGDTESSDDRDQLSDNLYLDLRFRSEVESGRASIDPGLFYRLQVGANAEFICVDTSLASDLGVEHYFDDPSHADWLREALAAGPSSQPRWRIPFSHHPPFCAGPEHGCTPGMVERLVPMYAEAGVRLVLSGHEHNFQHSVVDGIHYLVSGAGGKLETASPTDFASAGTRAWAASAHFLLIRLEEERALVHPVADVHSDGALELIEMRDPDGRRVQGPLEIR